jgi:hypothetical protein
MNRKISKDDVERLSKGLSSKSKTGSRNVPHRLTKKERIVFESAKKVGYLKLPANCRRENLVNIYLLWCQACGIEPKIL